MHRNIPQINEVLFKIFFIFSPAIKTTGKYQHLAYINISHDLICERLF